MLIINYKNFKNYFTNRSLIKKSFKSIWKQKWIKKKKRKKDRYQNIK